MHTERISDRVHYIGVNDRTTERFEALWPLPYGVSYNSYLVVGDTASAIIDGVELSHADQQIEHIKAILKERQPDYLIINHMEPDHSGGIKALCREFPNLTVVGNAQTLMMVEGFYGKPLNTLQVRDCDTLDLGGVKLSITLTPMVHWPETMMTYLAEEKLLFSGDAFGCFGALNGAVVDADMNTAHYFPEMLRYYACIVGRYGAFVQKALKKLEGTEICTICPTHGPVWRQQIAEVVDLYDKLSRYEPLDNGVTIVYGSMYGNTQAIAEKTAQALAAAGVRDIAVHNAAISNLSDILADLFRHRGIVIAAPTYSDGLFPPVENVLRAIATRKLGKRRVLLIGGHTWALKAPAIMEAILAEAGIEVQNVIAFKHAPKEQDIAQVEAAIAEFVKD